MGRLPVLKPREVVALLEALGFEEARQKALSRMCIEYVVPLQSKMAARIDALADDIEAASSSAQAKRLQKERDKLTKQLDELRRYDEQLRHYADQRIALDFDDGVEVNYGKFGNLLAEVKAVTGT
jgi:acyl-CoA reductase-like NAD-dependent aldehyde dehydrogenase